MNFGDRCALDHLDLKTPYQCCFGLLGFDGAGKSTAIKILTTMLDASSGSAKVAGFDVTTNPLEVRRRIGFVPQVPAVEGALTGTENLVLSADLHGLQGAKRDVRVHEALTFAGLKSVAGNLVKTYSSGMVRRLEVAQATLHRPEVLFLDEPTTGLDPVAKRTVWERLMELKTSAGMTIFLATQDMEEADYLCDQLGLLHQARLVVVGRPAEFRRQLGPHASLHDAIAAYSGADMGSVGPYREARMIGGAVSRLG